MKKPISTGGILFIIWMTYGWFLFGRTIWMCGTIAIAIIMLVALLIRYRIRKLGGTGY